MSVAIEVSQVTMKYRLASEKIDSVKQYFIKKIKKQISYEDFFALSDISFQIQKGEVMGIIGANGAGKSTLLKIISGIMKPTSGSVKRVGTIAPLIELGAGFNGELSGIENIYLNGLLLGYSRKMMDEKLDEIIEFSEIGRFLHVPLKNYSSGMKARLGFSIATAIKPDILIVDEVLSVGDIHFREKSEQRMLSMMGNGTTVLFVSHSLPQIRKLCNRVVWLEKGRVKEIGDPTDICLKFQEQKVR